MNVGHRVFIVEPGDVLIPVSQETFNAFYLRRQPVFVKYRNREIHFAVALYTLERRKPKEVFRIDSIRIRVLGDGSVDQEHEMESIVRALDGNDEPDQKAETPGNIVDAKRQFDRKTREHRHPKLSGLAHRKILDALFPSDRKKHIAK